MTLRAAIVGFAALVLTLGAGTSQLSAAARVALVVGNSSYGSLPDLQNAREDAEGMALKLRDLGFDVILRIDASRRELGRTLSQFENRLAKAEVGLVYYAGHGIQVQGKNYLVPADAEIEVEED